MLKIENLTKTYGHKKAVDDLSLHIESGSIYGVLLDIMELVKRLH